MDLTERQAEAFNDYEGPVPIDSLVQAIETVVFVLMLDYKLETFALLDFIRDNMFRVPAWIQAFLDGRCQLPDDVWQLYEYPDAEKEYALLLEHRDEVEATLVDHIESLYLNHDLTLPGWLMNGF